MGGAAGAGYSTRIKDYELLSQIGGVDDLSFLYLARHIPTRELVALKYTDLTISPDFELVEEVIHTIHITTHLSHPVLLPYRTSFVDADRLWSVTLPIRGGSCRQIMREYFPDGFGFKESVVATIVREIVRGVQYMHASHVLHNDIRASSILLSHTGAVLLTGLHAARPLLTSGLLHRSTFIPVGDNHEHAAPEIVAQGRRVGMPADVYSIGHTAVELAFGKTGFDGWPSCKILLCKLADECPAPDVGTGIGKGMSYEFWMFVECCTRRDPKKRPTTTELLEHPFLAMARDAKHVQKYVLK
ncbi:kinase-like protein, partial [Gonapodya prolifera JEL478]